MTRKNALIVCDHSLDPRLQKRKDWLVELGYDVDVYVDLSRGGHFKDRNLLEKPLTDLKVKLLDTSDLVYISGAKVIISCFLFMLMARLKGKKVIYEIPDLPLRSRYNFQNKIIAFVFRRLVGALFSNIVVTSNGFLPHLPAGKNYFLCENLPSVNIVKNINSSNKAKLAGSELNFGFVGALRYEEQMLMLIKYCLETKNRATFFGGPTTAINSLLEKCTQRGIAVNDLVKFEGDFTHADLCGIYSNIDFVYSVYDSSQPNVKLALPNKLYEAFLFETPIIVSKKTYLAEIVESEKIGFSVDSQDYNLFKSGMDANIKKSFLVSSDNIKIKIANHKKNFIGWVTSLDKK